jgi:hypothetical protein
LKECRVNIRLDLFALPNCLRQPANRIATSVMFDCLHGDIVKQGAKPTFEDADSSFDAFAMRPQVTI